MNQSELYNQAISTGDQVICGELIKKYGKPRKPISPLIFVLKENKEKEANQDGRNENDNGTADE